jgi:diguanylate cyclase (GGDEF)-like protein
MEPGDLLVRRGGDEFAVLTIVTPARDLEKFGRRIEAAIVRARTAVCPEVNPNASVTCIEHSFGESSQEFLRRVDDGLHDAKLDAHPERRAEELASGVPRAHADRVFSAGIEDDDGNVRLAARTASSAAERSDLRIAWRFTAAAVVTPALLMSVVAIAGVANDLRTPVVAGCIAGLFVCGAGAIVAAHRYAPIRLIHLPLGISLALLTVAISQASESPQALVELYAIAAPLVIYLLGWRAAMSYAAASAFFYAYFLVASDSNYAWMRSAIFVGAMFVLCVMLARGQRLTRQFADQAAVLSVIDPLTGVANLRGFHRRIEDEIGRCSLVGEGLALVMIDLDGFKFVNDRYSHTMGDAVLFETANAIQSTVREDELVARRGGDEFAIVCAPEAHADMDAFTARIAQSIEDARLRLTHDLPGGATVRHIYWEPGESPQDFMRRADAELHRAKALHRHAGDAADSAVQAESTF